jgi:hypothetical protein
MLCLVYFEHPAALEEIGYDAKPLREPLERSA